MRIQAGNLLRGLIPVVLLLAGTVVLCGEEAESAVAESSAISIRSAPIEGKIFLLTQERGQEEVAGANVYIRIRRPRERAFLYETKTLKDGSYEIPGLEPEDYHMLVGDLRLDLKVFPPVAGTLGTASSETAATKESLKDAAETASAKEVTNIVEVGEIIPGETAPAKLTIDAGMAILVIDLAFILVR